MKALVLAAAALSFSATSAFAQRAADPLEATISTSDVDAFFAIYDATNGRPTARDLQRYIEDGSPGVQGFIPNRIISAERLAARISDGPQTYADARQCAQQLGNLRERVRASFLALEALYPDATYPQTYILIGRDNSGGTANANALMIGLEVVCHNASSNASALDVHLAHLIAHEMIHSLQAGFAGETVLSQSLNEGAAEFLAELISGQISNAHLLEWTAGHEAEIEQRFAANLDSRDLSAWLYNGRGTAEAPGDLGYWVGYRIVRAYYERATDKRQAVRNILLSTDAHAFLAASGWRPAH
jgi:hypothetical protein